MNSAIHEDAGIYHNKASPLHDLIANIPRSGPPVPEKNEVGKKRAERVSRELPVNLGNASGTTRNLSATGVFFETDATYPLLSSSMRFEMEFDTPDGRVLVKCLGEIVRLEPRNQKVGVAVKIIESLVEPI
jgi:hypothetical protein